MDNVGEWLGWNSLEGGKKTRMLPFFELKLQTIEKILDNFLSILDGQQHSLCRSSNENFVSILDVF